jgi:PAS domain S-box-containing protein
MWNSLRARLSVSFRLVMLLLVTFCLFFGVISVNNRITMREPDSGLIAVEGDDFVHISFREPGLTQEQSQLQYFPPGELTAKRLQVLLSVVGQRTNADGTELTIAWSAPDWRADERVLHFRLLRSQEVLRVWQEPYGDVSEIFPRLDRALGGDGRIMINYLPDQLRASGAPVASTISVLGRDISSRPSWFVELAAGFSFLIIGFAIYFSSASRRLQHIEQFFLVSLSFFVLFVFSYPPLDAPLAWAIFWTYKLSYLFTPAMLLHFLLLHEHDGTTRLAPRRLVACYAAPAIALALNLAAAIVHVLQVGAQEFPPAFEDTGFYQVVHVLESFLFPTMVGFVLFLLFKSYHPAATFERKRQIKWLFWGLGLGLLPFGLVNYPLQALRLENEFVKLAVSLPLLVTPVSFALAVFSQRYLDVEVIFKRGFIYFVTSFGLLGIYLFIMFGLNQYAGEISFEALVFISGGMILLATLISHRLKDQVQSFFDRFLYRDFYNFRRTLQDFGVELSYERDLERLLGKIADRIDQTFAVPVVIMFISSADREHYVLAHASGRQFPARYLSLEASREMAKRLAAGRPVYIDQIADLSVAHLFREAGAVIFIPFVSLGQVIGFISLGPTAEGDILTADDLDLLASLADRAAAAIDNAMLYLDLQNRVEQFRQLKEFSENIVESVDSGICTVDAGGRVQSWNTALENLFGTNRAEAVGQPLLDLLPQRLANVIEPYLHGDAGDSFNLYKVTVSTRERGDRVLNISFAPMGGASGDAPGGDATAGTVLIVDDISEGVKMEEQLGQQEKLASLGMLAAGVAHEVNTPLTGISSYVQMLQRRFGEDSDSLRLLEKVEKQAVRASRIINNLLNFSRQAASETSEINFNTLIADSLTLVENQLKYPTVRVTTDLEEELFMIEGDRIKLQQVLINLLLNARDSMPDGGEIRITTRNAADAVRCSISDSGSGIPRAVLPKIFDPFFTTKKIGQGTGLGLSVSYGIISDHKGNIDVESEPGAGTTFIITLPARRNAPAVAEKM